MVQREVEYVATELSRKEYQHCTKEHVNNEERQARIQEIGVLRIRFHTLHKKKYDFERVIYLLNPEIRQRDAFEAGAPLEAWLPPAEYCATESHNPKYSLELLDRGRSQWLRKPHASRALLLLRITLVQRGKRPEKIWRSTRIPKGRGQALL